MKLVNFFKKKGAKKQYDSLADFFLHASPKEKKRIFTEVAHRANADQRALVKNIDQLENKAIEY